MEVLLSKDVDISILTLMNNFSGQAVSIKISPDDVAQIVNAFKDEEGVTVLKEATSTNTQERWLIKTI